jgi:uncharacterized protein (TIGR04255 family)
MYKRREVFANTPLEYVAAEIKFPYAPRLRRQDLRDAILIDLEDLFPILRTQEQVTMTGPAGGPLTQQVDQVSRGLNKASDASVLLTTTAVVIDTTAYREFSDFRRIVERCLGAVDAHVPIAAVERVGLRYIDEVRVPSPIEDARDWRGWLANSVIEMAGANPDERAVISQGAVQYSTGEFRKLVFRFASSLQGTGLSIGELLRRRRAATDGPFFLLDFDSFWEPPSDHVLDWRLDDIMAIVDSLHDPIGMTFQSVITDQLRDVVLRRKADGDDD